jgi:hypothetical protein
MNTTANDRPFETILRQLIRDEVRRLVRAEALEDDLESDLDDSLRLRALSVADRFRRVRSG